MLKYKIPQIVTLTHKQYENLFLSQARKEPYPMYFRYFFLINNM